MHTEIRASAHVQTRTERDEHVQTGIQRHKHVQKRYLHFTIGKITHTKRLCVCHEFHFCRVKVTFIASSPHR